jgi:tryptophanyl-tRNA synthetase
MTMKDLKKKIVFSGIRPTGPAHLGNYAGAMSNWVRLQDEYRCFYSIVSWHALSSEYQNSRIIRDYTLEMAIDLLSVGLDPRKCVLFVQSDVKEHAELHLLLSMITPLPWVERVPTFKDMQKELADRDINTYGYLGYPVLQTADIILYKADIVPVGEDQAAHLELAREITRRFNRLFGEVFPEPQIMLTETPRLAGTDGRKMSKSFGNAIYLKDSPEIVRAKIAPMVTDTRRKRRSDAGEPKDCPVFTLHEAFVEKERRAELARACRSAGIGCLECKTVVIETLIRLFAPYRERRAKLEADPDLVRRILEQGNARARKAARRTMAEVRAAIGL